LAEICSVNYLIICEYYIHVFSIHRGWCFSGYVGPGVMPHICLQCYIVLQLNWKLCNQISLLRINEFVLCCKIWILFIFFDCLSANGRKYPRMQHQQSSVKSFGELTCLNRGLDVVIFPESMSVYCVKIWGFVLLCFRNLSLYVNPFVRISYACLFHPLKFWIVSGQVHVPVGMSSLF